VYSSDEGSLDFQVTDSGKLFVHITPKPDLVFTKAMYHRWVEFFDALMDEMSSRGIHSIYSLIPNDEKVLQFNTMMGMVPVLELHKDKTVYGIIMQRNF